MRPPLISIGNLREGFALGILSVFSGVCAGVIVYDEIIGRNVDNTILTILAFIIGVLSHQLGSQQGSSQTSTAVREAVDGRLPPIVPSPPQSAQTGGSP